VSRSPHRLEPVSATFHGRDVFAPAAAALAAGAQLAGAGDPLDPDALKRVELPEPRSEDGALVAHVLAVDRFGNVSLNVGGAELAGAGLQLAETGVEPGRPIEVDVAGRSFAARRATTFADVAAGELILYEDARRSLALAINRGDAAATLGIAPDTEVRLRSG
jgi:S-adenosylmethionine hydrolase